MGKVLKKVGKIAAVAAIVGGVALTGGLLFAGAPLATAIGGAFSLSVGGLGISLGAIAAGGAIASSIGASLSKPKLPSFEDTAAADRLVASINPQAMGVWAFGETALATDVIYAEQLGADNSQAVQVIAAAAHTITEYGDLYINDELVTFSGSTATGAWAGALSRYTNIGTETQTALPVPGWTRGVEARHRGIAEYALVWTASHEKVKSGISSRITQVAKTGAVYDPRLDTTVGGSGTHRTNDQSTWAYSNAGVDIGANWALVVLKYLLGWRINSKRIFGLGVDPVDIDYASFIAAANVCDALVDGIPRYHIGGLQRLDGDNDRVLRELEAMIAGAITKGGDGKWYVWAPHNDLVAVGSIGEDDILRDAGVVFQPAGDIRNLANTGRGRFISPALLYQPDDIPEVVEAAALTDDGVERLLELDFSAVQSEKRAERVLRTAVRRTRFQGRWTVAVGPKGLLYKFGDVLTLNIQETNFTDTLARVVSFKASATGAVVLELLEEDASIYDTTIPLGSLAPRNAPATFDPATKFAVVGLSVIPFSLTGTLGTATDALKVSWTDPGPLVERTEIEYRKTGDTDWIGGAAVFIAGTVAIVSAVEPGTGFDVRVRHVSVAEVAGDWVQTTATSTATEKSADVINVGGSPAQDVADQAAGAFTTINIANPDFELGNKNWIGDGSIVTGAPGQSHQGDNYLLFNGASQKRVNDKTFTVQPGERTILEGYYFPTDIAAGAVRIGIRWLDADGAIISETFTSS